MIENLKDKEIVEKVLNKLNIVYEEHKYFNDGASSRVILLNNKYLIKQNDKLVLQAEIEFLKLNQLDIFQKIIYIDDEYEFVVYNFIHGDVMRIVDKSKDVLRKLVDVCYAYKSYDKAGFGYLNEEVETWKEFLKSEIEYSSKNILQYIPSTNGVYEALEILDRYSFDKKLLHGDFGTHNFIHKDGSLIGIIDPMPVIGDVLYDLLFAIASNVQLLTAITIKEIRDMIEEPEEKVRAMFKIVIYCRISRCLKYHPKDIDIYMEYWNSLNK